MSCHKCTLKNDTSRFLYIILKIILTAWEYNRVLASIVFTLEEEQYYCSFLDIEETHDSRILDSLFAIHTLSYKIESPYFFHSQGLGKLALDKCSEQGTEMF